jgi:tetratricopeptide (TPR) repeat protein
LAVTGRIAEAVRAADRAVALDPAPVRFSLLGAVLQCDGRSEEAERAYLRGIRLDPDESFQNIRWNYVFMLYGEQRYEEALDRFIPLLDDTVDVERARTDARRRFGWLRQGTLSAIPDTAREDLAPEDWVHLGYPDSAAAHLAATDSIGPAIARLYVLCYPMFDDVRQLPVVQEYLRNRGLDGVMHRTPAGQRETPVVLRETASAAANGAVTP